jgi:phage replication O-like protein O
MDNYTQVPNFILDEWMANMTGSAFKVLMTICRKTLGWQKVSDDISLTQIERLSGLTRPSVINAIKELEEKELIFKDQSTRMNNYKLNISKDTLPIQNEIVNNFNQISKDTLPEKAEDSKITLHTKESIKENKQKKRKHERILPKNIEEVLLYAKEKNIKVDIPYFYGFFTASNWVDSNGKEVWNWKQKLLTWNNYNKQQEKENQSEKSKYINSKQL